MEACLPRKLRQLIQCTDYTLCQIAEMTGVDYQLLRNAYELHYSQSYRAGRELRCNKQMKSRRSYKESRHVRPSGYVEVRKPDWFTGRTSRDFVPEHQVVMCEALSLTEIPKGMVVHHIDQNKENNSVDNLQLMTNAAHSKLHWALRKASYGEVQCSHP
jgi:HNH endonuclease.